MKENMKNIINIKSMVAVMILALGLLSACRDESILVYDPPTQGTLGFYPHMIDEPVTSISIASATNGPTTATYKFTPEIVGGAQSEVASFEISVELVDDLGVTVVGKDKKLVGTVTDFPVDATSKRPRGTITITAAQVNTALSLTPASYIAKYNLVFHEKLNMKTRGSVDENNINPNLAGPAYKAPMFHYVLIKP
jgi:hypothetical protein